MSIQVNRLLNDFQHCLAELAVVSGGSYVPPVGVIETMREAAGKVDGLDSAQLVAQSSAAAGARRDKGDGFRAVLDVLSAGSGMQLAGGALEELLRRFQSDHEEDQAAGREFADGAQNCGNAVDDIRDSSEIGLTEILGSTIPVVQIVTRLLRLHPVMRMGGIIATLANMIIEPAVSSFMRVVGDRDDAISGCYEEFLRRCEQMCDKELVDPPAGGSCQPEQHSSQPGKEVHSGKDMHTEKQQVQTEQQTTKQSAQTQTTQTQSAQTKQFETKPLDKPLEPVPPAKPVPEAPTNPAGQAEPCEPQQPCTPQPGQQPVPAPEPTQLGEAPTIRAASSIQSSCEIDICCIGQMAAAGLGMAAIGAQLVIDTATQCLEQMDCEVPQPPAPEPQPVVESDCPPEPAPQPVAEPTPEPEPEPEPCPDPQEKPDPEPIPEPIPEPDPEPAPEPVSQEETIERPMPEHSVDKKQFHSGPAQVAPEPQAQPETPVEQAPQPAPNPQPEPASAPEQSTKNDQEVPAAGDERAANGNTHRMGQW